MKKNSLLVSLLFTATMYAVNAQTVFLNEDFQASALPSGWSQVTNATDGGWNFGSASSLSSSYFSIPTHTNIAATNDDKCNCTKDNDRLITSSVDLSNATSAFLSFDILFYAATYQSATEVGTIEISTDGGTTWTIAETLTGKASWDDNHIVNMSSYVGNSNVMVSFKYNDGGGYLYGMAVDNLKIYQPYSYDAAVMSIDIQDYVALGNQNVAGTLFNYGSSAITSLDINYQVNGGSVYTQTLSSLNIGLLTSYNYSHPTVWAPSTSGVYVIKTWASNLNGNADMNNTNDTTTKTITIPSFFPNHIVVVEEGTGTWCGWCPRGAVFMDSLAAVYPTTSIGIAVHNGDPMTNSTYDNGLSPLIGGFPTVVVDRVVSDDPSNVFDVYDNVIGNFAFAELTLNCTFDQTTRKLRGYSSANFAASLNGDYRFAIAITEDNVAGTATGYAQQNYYSYESQDLPLVGAGHDWQSEPKKVPATDMEYDHVARFIAGGFNGKSGTLPSSITEGNTYTDTTLTYTVPASYNMANINAYLLLINATNGHVLNGAKGAITVGIDQPKADKLGVNVYPNPFANNANISFNLQKAENVKVNVYNIIGELVYSIDNGQMSKGEHKVKIDGSKLPSGMYFVNLITGENNIVTKVSLNK